MLVLSRKKNESVIIDNDIRILVMETRGGRIRLGIEAPKDVAVYRWESRAEPRRDVTREADPASPHAVYEVG
jgi:carbon storage regulator